MVATARCMDGIFATDSHELASCTACTLLLGLQHESYHSAPSKKFTFRTIKISNWRFLCFSFALLAIHSRNVLTGLNYIKSGCKIVV